MNDVRHLSIEIGPRCNLACEHVKCPAHERVIDREPLSIERITKTIEAARSLGFRGYVSFHFYNEPTLYPERIEEVVASCPDARYMLWTNNPIYEHPSITWYSRSDYSNPDYPFDERLHNYDELQPWHFPCHRPLIECAIDYSGRVALCCQDWKLTSSPGDVSVEDPTEVLTRWYQLVQQVKQMNVPSVCDTCKGRMNAEQHISALAEVGM